MIPDEFERLIYHCAMGGAVVVISPDDELAKEHFEELRKAVSVAAEDLRILLEKAEQEIIWGQSSEVNSLGMMDDYLKSIEWLPISNPGWKIKWYCVEKWNAIRKVVQSRVPCRRCRWRQRESRRMLAGLSPGIVVLDEEVG